MDDRVFAGLNEQQAEAVSAVRGPVVILAGAGSGKTTTITRRIANQLSTGTFGVDEILAVTFTEKAAREMGARLERLGVPAVRARTFHAEALAQYRQFSGDSSEIVPSKGQILAPLIQRLPMPHKFTSVRDVATEIEWAKNRRVPPGAYKAEIEQTGHVPPLPPDLMAGLYSSYERRKEQAGLIDFEDLLERTIALLDSNDRARMAVRSRYRAFTVDEYQDVNLLQQTLLECWVGERQDLCVVGDDYQSIFGFTGATPRYLLGFEDRYPDAQVFRLTRNYRSSPQVLEVANRLVPKLGGSHRTLRAVRGGGPAVVFREHPTGDREVDWIVRRCRALRDTGIRWEDMAVLYRVNGRSEELEEAFSRDRLPYQVKDGAFLRRPAARALLARLRRAEAGASIGATVERIATSLGMKQSEETDPDETTRQADLARLVAIASEFGVAHPDAGPAEFVAELQRRFAPERDGRGVQIMTYHRAKGLEFDVVFLPRMEDKELPFALSRSDQEVAEERRLLYVGITRAREHLLVSWAAAREGERRRAPKRSPFLDEIRPSPVAAIHAAAAANPAGASTPARPPVSVAPEHVGLLSALKEWRLGASRRHAVPAYVVFHDATLAQIAETRPQNVIELGRINGIGPAKISRYGNEVLDLVSRHSA